LDCVESIFKSSYDNFEVIVVDNASIDQSHLRCKEKFNKIILIENEKNLGYCGGNNVGILRANGKFVVILNPDTIVTPNWLDELIKAYNENGEGLYQPKVLSLYEKNILQSTGNMMQLFGFGFSRDKGEVDSGQRNKVEQVTYASGTCLFTLNSTIKKIGLFDPFLFLYHDDLELGWRAAINGINSYYVPFSVIYHAESYNLKWSSKKFFWLERNRRYCIKTHFSETTYKKIRKELIMTEIMVWIYYILKGFLLAKIKAEIDISKNKEKILKKYQEIEMQKKISDAEIIKKFSDEIHVPKNVSGSLGVKMFNYVISRLSKKARSALSI